MKRGLREMHHGGVIRPATPPISAPDHVTAVFGRYLLTGDEEAIDEVVAATRPRLLAAARRIGNPHDAEDAVQTAFLSLIRHRGAPFDAPVVPWLLTAVVRTAYRRKAVARREVGLADRLAMAASHEAAVSDPAADEDADVVRLRAEVARLPDRYRDPVVLHHLQGLSTVETARLLDVSDATVRTRLHRARRLVRSRWSPRTAAAVLYLPWFLADVGRGGGLSATGTAIASGGLMTASAALPIGVVLALGLGVLAGRTLFAPAPGDAALAEARATARERELEAEVGRLSQALAGRSELASAPRPAAAAPSTAGVAAGAPPSVPGTESGMGALPAGSEPRRTASIPVAGYEKVLDAVDWGEVGKNLSAMSPALTKFVEGWLADGKPPLELAGAVQSHNGPLLKAAGMLSKSLKIENPNVAFTHPAFQGNAIAAALEAAGHPLDEAQRAAVSKLVTQAVDDEASRAGRYDERTLAVRRLIDQADVRDRFFDGVRALLSPEQLPVLGAPQWRGRLQADVYSSGLIWATVAQGIPSNDREGFVAQFSGIYAGQFGVPAASMTEFTSVVSEWAREIPDDFFRATPDPRDALGLVPVAQVADFARRQATLADRTIERMKLDDAALTKIRAFGFVIFPIRTAPKADAPK